MSDDNKAAERKALLKRLRAERADLVAKSREKQKARRDVRRKVKKALESGATTVPALAEAADLSKSEVLWHIASMRKYGEVVEVDTEGDYPGYRLAEEGAKS
ncbi:MAG: hypothetical protein ABFS86_07175 [Planctomycetota bacterium]